MRNVEGGSAESAMRILRHEAGHAIDTAYRLRRRKRWREMFGRPRCRYPGLPARAPGSRRYVQHLGEWYAQAHPCEDFAETFAVWLKPNSSWRRTYAQWPAFHKLEFVDELLDELARHARRRCAIAKWSSRCARTRTRWPITIAASCAATACTAAPSPITCSSACSPPSDSAASRQHFPARERCISDIDAQLHARALQRGAFIRSSSSRSCDRGGRRAAASTCAARRARDAVQPSRGCTRSVIATAYAQREATSYEDASRICLIVHKTLVPPDDSRASAKKKSTNGVPSTTWSRR